MATMAFPSLLQSTSSSFHRERAAVRFPALRGSSCRRAGVLSIRAAKMAVLVDKSDAEKVHRLKTTYLEKIVPVLKEEFGYTNVHLIPKVEKIVVNCGIGDAAQNAKGLEAAMNDLAIITGQRPVKTRARKPISSFKIRKGQVLGLMVTLRRKYMYAFLDRLINLGLPRSKDFIGVSPNSFDGHGNYSIGLRDQAMFPEIEPEAGRKARGMEVCITTTAKTDKEGFRLLELMGMPFRDEEDEEDYSFLF